MYDENQIKDLFNVMRDAELEMPPEMLTTPLSELCVICNGVGGSNMPEWARDMATAFFKAIEATAAVHDFMYDQSDGSIEGQRHADNLFLTNGLAEIYWRYGAFNWRRYIARLKLMCAYDALRGGGRWAWLEAAIAKIHKAQKAKTTQPLENSEIDKD